MCVCVCVAVTNIDSLAVTFISNFTSSISFLHQTKLDKKENRFGHFIAYCIKVSDSEHRWNMVSADIQTFRSIPCGGV